MLVLLLLLVAVGCCSLLSNAVAAAARTRQVTATPFPTAGAALAAVFCASFCFVKG
jgi:hypothetical protein